MLIDSGADLLIYGMSEKQVVEVANKLNSGLDIKEITEVPGTCYVLDNLNNLKDFVETPSYKEICKDKTKYAEAFKLQYDEQDPVRGKTVVQRHTNGYLVQNKPEMPLTREELDKVYALPYEKNYHPSYKELGGIPAIEEVKFSVVSSRGCFGSCAFCAITFHQGRIVQSRSEESILEEAKGITEIEDFKGYIHDIGGPTANFRQPACKKQLKVGACKDKQCLYPNPCKNMDVDHMEYLSLLRKVRELPRVKKVFVRSGLRYDYIMADKNETFFNELINHHVSGQLKVAPEHVSPVVLKYMGKPAGKTYDRFMDKFYKINDRLGKKQYIIPYLMSSHPGSNIEAAVELAEYLRDIGYQPEQVQDFYPTPGTLSTTMFYTGLDPLTMEEVHIPKTRHEKAMQRALLQFKDPMKYDLVYEALVQAGRDDLIGYGAKCLVKPRVQKNSKELQGEKGKTKKKAQGIVTGKNNTGEKDYKKQNNKGKSHKDKSIITDKQGTGKSKTSKNEYNKSSSRTESKKITKGKRR